MKIKLGPYRKIYTRIWNDEKFNALSDDGKLSFFFLSTHPHLMPIGAMRSTIPGLASELHWVTKRFRKAFDEIQSKSMVKYDEKSSFLWLPNFIKYNFPESPNVVLSWEQYLHYLPECGLRNDLLDNIHNFSKLNFTAPFQQALPKAFCKGSPNQEQEQDQKQEQKTNKSDKSDVLCRNKIFSENKEKQDESLYWDQAKEILIFLNQKANKTFKPSHYNLYRIVERLKSGATVKECKQVIARMCRLWKGKNKTAEWLRPKTLFEGDNYAQYSGELVMPNEAEINISNQNIQ